MTDDESKFQNCRRRSARISNKRTVADGHESSSATTRAAVKRPFIDPSFNPYRRQSKGELSLTSGISPPLSNIQTMSSDDEEGFESITPAFRPKKGPVHTYVSLSTSTAATASCINNGKNTNILPNSNKTVGKNASVSVDSEKHILRRLLEDDKGRRKSSRNSSRTNQSSKAVPAACTSSSLSISNKVSSKLGSKHHRSSAQNNEESCGGKRSKRKIDGLSNSLSTSSATKTRKKLDAKALATHYHSKLQKLNALENRKNNSKDSRSTIKSNKTTENGLAIFDCVPDGVFDLDSLHKSAMCGGYTTHLDEESVDHTTRSKKRKKSKIPCSFAIKPQIKLHIVASRDANGTVLSNDDDTCFLAQYSLDYYNYLFDKDKRTVDDAKPNPEEKIKSQQRLLRSSRSKSKQSETTIVVQSPDSVSSTSTTESAKTVPAYMKHQIHLATFMRAILVDWLIEISDEYKLQAITLHTAVRLMDRALESVVIKRKDLQCLGCACMLIACKLEEVTPMTSTDYVYVSDKTYSRKEITKMEKDIFNALQFRLYDKVTPLHFLHRFFRASDVSFHQKVSGSSEDTIDQMSNSSTMDYAGGIMDVSWGTDPVFQYMVEYLLELGLLQPEFVDSKASLIAASSLYLARAMLGIRDRNGNIWNETLTFFTTYNVDELKTSVLKLHAAHSSILTENLSCISKKYKRKNFYSVALKPGILKEDLGFD